jgi:hypothetical protein
MPTKAGIQVSRFKIAWIPAFAGMTIFVAENSPIPQMILSLDEYDFTIIKIKIYLP